MEWEVSYSRQKYLNVDVSNQVAGESLLCENGPYGQLVGAQKAFPRGPSISPLYGYQAFLVVVVCESYFPST